MSSMEIPFYVWYSLFTSSDVRKGKKKETAGYLINLAELQNDLLLCIYIQGYVLGVVALTLKVLTAG